MFHRLPRDRRLILRQYQKLKNEALALLEGAQIEKALTYFQVCASYARRYHLGLWQDDDLERALLRISTKINDSINDMIQTLNNERVLFISSSITDYGGHTNAMINWIDCLKNKKQIYCVNTYGDRKNGTVSEEKLKRDTVFYELPANCSAVEKTVLLQKKIKEISAKHIVLFIDPDDIITLTALGKFVNSKGSDKPIVYFFNHADHAFWLGINVTDVLINFRTISIDFSKKTRGFKKIQVVIPLKKKEFDTDIKVELPQNSSKTLSLTIGSAWKIMPDERWNYFKVLEKILNENPDHGHILVSKLGGTLLKKAQSLLKKFPRRFYLIDGIPNPSELYKKADFIIETFPVSGGTVRVDTISLGKPIICIENSKCHLFSSTDDIPKDYPLVAAKDEDVVFFASRLISNPGFREEIGLKLLEFYRTRKSFSCRTLEKLFENQIPTIADKMSFDLNVDDDYLFDFDIRVQGLNSPYFYLIQYYLERFDVIEALKVMNRLFIDDLLKIAVYILSRLKNRLT